MSVAPVNISKIAFSRRFVKAMASRSLIPLIMLEACVEAGRTRQAYKRGGFTEARERITEEMIGAFFWFSGVPGFNWLIDKVVGKKIMKLPTTNFDTGKDAGRDSIKNFIKFMKEHGFKDAESIRKMLAKYKFGKVAAAVVLANCLVGFAVPKLNQTITKKLSKKQQQEKQTPQLNTQKYNLAGFLNKTGNTQNVSFTAISAQNLLDFANKFENTPKYQLLSEDVGVAAGRGICARNKYERIEVLFRDITSSYFYMFNMPIIVSLMNRLEHSYPNRLDPVASKVVTDHLLDVVKNNGGEMKLADFENAIFGDYSQRKLITPELDKIIQKNGGNIDVEEFIKMYEKSHPNIGCLARKMSELQPAIEGKRILTEAQIKDVFKGGKINSPEFLKDLYTVVTSDDKLYKVKAPTFLDEFKFVSTKDLHTAKKEAEEFVHKIMNHAKKGTGKVTEKLLNKLCRENLLKNALNWGTGFAVSALFLSTLIPKMQYWITKTLTGSNAFPGTTEYTNKN